MIAGPTNSDGRAPDGDDRLVILRDLVVNDRLCTLRVTVGDGMVGIAFDAAHTDAAPIVVGSLTGTILLDDLVPVTEAITLTLGGAAKALGLTESRHSADPDEVRSSSRWRRAYRRRRWIRSRTDSAAEPDPD
ncbi:hypothetical protein [Krasilnikovia sp. M28-CT-15]|uniref:hypothetical protein n=1 Tax=Krasilnikovia sp. M28-CT-15 TaxID=3373540 RepID=UPI003876A026